MVAVGGVASNSCLARRPGGDVFNAGRPTSDRSFPGVRIGPPGGIPIPSDTDDLARVEP